MEKTLGLYIHIPFCLSKCPYCDFYSTRPEPGALDAYAAAVCRALACVPHTAKTVDTVYFGGGTPVLLGVQNLAAILEAAAKHFHFKDLEATVEANPAVLGKDAFKYLYYAGFNRISFGVQSANHRELLALGRLHTAAQSRQSVLDAEKAGFRNISADLMLGVPHQTRESLDRSIAFLRALPLSHVSAYMLKIEENTAFAKRGPDLTLPGEDALADLYLRATEKLGGLGFSQYEISNFAKKGAVSRHNLKYWTLGEYLGIGPAAHSFMDGKRFFIPRDLNAFIRAENPLSLAKPDGGGGGFEEYAMLGLRLTSGLNLAKAAQVYGADTGKIIHKAKPLEKMGLLKLKNDVLSLTPQGFLLSNAVISSLLY